MTGTINNNKEIPPTGGIANIFVSRKNINSGKIYPPKVEAIVGNRHGDGEAEKPF